MRSHLSLIANLLLFAFLANASNFSPFLSALESWDEQLSSNETSHELLKRASNSCPTNYNACSDEGASGLCCAKSQVCTADANGYVACCPTGASCTGTITGVVTAGTIGSGTVTTSTSNLLTSDTTTATTSSTSNGLVLASATSTTTTGDSTTTDGFIIAASTTVATLEGYGTKNVHIPPYAQYIIRVFEYLAL